MRSGSERQFRPGDSRRAKPSSCSISQMAVTTEGSAVVFQGSLDVIEGKILLAHGRDELGRLLSGVGLDAPLGLDGLCKASRVACSLPSLAIPPAASFTQ